MTVRLVLVGGPSIIGQGVHLILEEIDGVDVVGTADECDDYLRRLVNEVRPDVVLDSTAASNGGKLVSQEVVELVRHYDVDIVLMVARSQHGEVGAAVRGGVNGLVCEDDGPEELSRAINAVASGGAWLSQQLSPELFDHYRRTVDRVGSGPETAPLSSRERDVLSLVAKGRSNVEIASDLGLAESTIKTHVSRILRKLSLRDRTQLAHFAHQNFLV